MLYVKLSHFEKLTGVDLSRYLNKFESTSLRKAQYYRHLGDLTV